MTIAQQEIFGPVLVVIPYEDEDDAVRIANDSKYGLSGGVFSASVTRRAIRVVAGPQPAVSAVGCRKILFLAGCTPASTGEPAPTSAKAPGTTAPSSPGTYTNHTGTVTKITAEIWAITPADQPTQRLCFEGAKATPALQVDGKKIRFSGTAGEIKPNERRACTPFTLTAAEPG